MSGVPPGVRGGRGDGDPVTWAQDAPLAAGLHGDLPVPHLEAFGLAAVQVRGWPDHVRRDADLEHERLGSAAEDGELLPGDRVLHLAGWHGRSSSRNSEFRLSELRISVKGLC